MAVSPEFVLRGFSSEPTACCGCSVTASSVSMALKLYAIVGLNDGSVEVWHVGTYRAVARSAGNVFPSKSPVLSVRAIKLVDRSLVVAESKVHELVFFKLSLPESISNNIIPEFTKTFNLDVSPDCIAPSFCQVDCFSSGQTSEKEPETVITVRSSIDSSLLLSKFRPNAPEASNDSAVVRAPQQLCSKLGSAMFVKFIAHCNSLLMVCGFESSHILLWSISLPDMTASLLDHLLLSSLLDKTENDDEMDLCPTCADIAGVSNAKSSFILIGMATNAVVKLLLNEDLTGFVKPPQIVRTAATGVTSLSIRPDRKLAAVGFSNGSICLVSPKSLSVLGVLSFHNQSAGITTRTISGLDFIPLTSQQNTWLLAASCRDKTLSLWNIYNNN